MKTPPSYVSTSCSSNAAIFREYRHWPCANPGPVPTTPVTPPMALPGPSRSYSAVRRGDNWLDAPSPPTSHELPSPHTPWQMDITQHRNYLFVKSLPEEEAACSQEFYQLEMKSSQSPSIRRHRANVREHSKHRYIQPSCMAAERGLCARLPPSFGHYTALNIVGKDPTDQSTSWMSTTDEPSDHEPMFSQSSPCLATSILQDPLHFSHAWGHAARKYFSKTLQTLWSLANVRAASTMACYVAHSMRWTNFNFCNMASYKVSQWFERWDAFWRCLTSERSDWVRTDHIAQFSLTATLHIAWITAPPNWALRHEFSSLLLMSSTPSSLHPSFVIGCFLLVGIPHCLLTRKFAQNFIPCPSPWVLPDMDCIDFHSV